MTQLTPLESHPDWTVGEIVTANGAAGQVESIWQDAQGNIYLALTSAAHDPDEGAWPVSDIVRGGTLPLHPPTLQAVSLHPKVYRIVKLTEPDGSVPTGWAVLHLHDNAYVAWGLPSRRCAEDIALGHQLGTRHLAGKF